MRQENGPSGYRWSALWGTGGRGGGDGTGERGKFKFVVASVAAMVVGVFAPAALADPGSPNGTTAIDSGPVDGALVTPGYVQYAFSSTIPGARFECRIDGSGWRSCRSPYRRLVLSLKTHEFDVRAVYPNGQRDLQASAVFNTVLWKSSKVYPQGSLLARAQANPYDKFDVIVQTDNRLLQKVILTYGTTNGKVEHDYVSIPAINAKLPGWAVLGLAENQALFGRTIVTEDVKMKPSEYTQADFWPSVVGADRLWNHDAVTCPIDTLTGLQLDPTCVALPAVNLAPAPAIAVVDSGVDPSVAGQFGARVVASVPMASDEAGSVADGYGHGTFVASMAAGGSSDYPGVAPTANIVSLKVIDSNGAAYTSDVIAAADWILQHKDQYGIKVANFSLHSAQPASFRVDPLDRAVERLWFAGVTVVAASGNFGDGTEQAMAYAPGNDPFVITVGATDMQGTPSTDDDTVAPWSAYGHTLDGFAKPEVVAPGRYLVSTVPAGSKLTVEKASNVIAPGVIRLSGTSFSAPVVSGAAAQILAVHPDWTPGQVKGALMATAAKLPNAPQLAQGFGEINLARASALASAPNPNAGLDQFVETDLGTGGQVFDDVSWADAAQSNPAWDDVSWADVSWADVSWADVSWADVSWADVSWADVSWADVSWADVSWADSSGADVSWADAASADVSWADVSWADVSWADNAKSE